MNELKQATKAKAPRKLTALKVIGLLVVVVLVFAFGPMIFMTDGTEKLNGVKLDAARSALEFDRGVYSPGFVGIVTRPHVDKVEPSPQGKDQYGNPLRCMDDPNLKQYYTVTLRRIGIFGHLYVKQDYRVCNTAG